MLKKFSPRNFNLGCGGMRRPGWCQRLCWRLGGWLWPLFALAAFLQFAYLLWSPGCYLLAVLFLQVVGLLIWLYNSRC